MTGRFVLALDQGTTSSRALVVDVRGAVVAAAARPLTQFYPRPGWVEHDPEEIWNTQLEAAREALSLAGVSANELAGVGITNQRETTVIWERSSGRPIANAIVWQCRRTAEACDALVEAGQAEFIQSRTGLVVDAYFSGTKISWLLDEIPGARAQAEAGKLAFGTVDSWLIWRLTGGAVHATDRTNASRTLLFNLAEDRWDSALCELLRVPTPLLPEVHPSVAPFGAASADLFGAALPITGVAGDQQAALFGQACFTEGMTKNTYGTGCFVLRNVGDAPPGATGGLLATAAASATIAPAFALEGAVFVAGAAVQWLRDGLGLIRTAAEIEPLAASVPDSGGVHVVPAFVGLGAPYWDPYARGTITGLTRGATAAHIARATLDAIAWQTREVLDLFDAASRSAGELRVDGGASANDLLLQIQADALGRAIVRPANLETTAMGAAYLAGIGAGVWDGPGEVASLWRADRVFEPRLSAAEREERFTQWRRAVERARGWAAPSPALANA